MVFIGSTVKEPMIAYILGSQHAIGK